MKKSLYIIALTAFIGTLSMAMPAHADWYKMFFSPEKDFRPYLKNGQDSQDLRFRNEPWTVTDWATDQKTGKTQVLKFFNAGVFKEYESATFWQTPTLVVGKGFYHLSSYDQARAVTLFDHVYGATARKSGTLFVEDGFTGRTIGIYTPKGLQLQ